MSTQAKLTRRAALVGVAALAAALSAAPSAAADTAPPNQVGRAADDDRELLNLAAAFEALWPVFSKANLIASNATDAALAEWEQRGRRGDLFELFGEFGREEAVCAASDIAAQMDAIADQMMRLPTRTVAGLVAKLRIYQFNQWPATGSPDPMDDTFVGDRFAAVLGEARALAAESSKSFLTGSISPSTIGRL